MVFMRLSGVVASIFLIAAASAGQSPTPSPDPIRAEVTVTANRVESQLSETPASIFVLSRAEVESSAAHTLDDILRQSVGFSIFRRSSSRHANPTTQGVSLRGVGASGASRTGVFLDGVPLNDAFGGWVQWNRVPTIAVERLETLRGGASSLYGEAALSGAVNVIPRRVESRVLSIDVFGGTQRTMSGALFAGIKRGGWSADISASNLQLRGYTPIEDAARGSVDVPAGVRASALISTLRRQIGDAGSVFIRPGYFGEVRSNGTPLQTNRTHSRFLAAGGEFRADRRQFRLDWRAYAGIQVYDQTFSTVAANRNSETLNRIQRVPSNDVGGSIQVSGVFGDHTLLVGADVRRVTGASDEIGIGAGNPINLSGAGGRQVNASIFAQDIYKFGERGIIVGSVRYHDFANSRGLSVTRVIGSGNAATVFADREESAVVPNLAVQVKITDRVALFASASRNFRSPTLNELYRNFGVGNVFTAANAELRSERSTNFEAGVRFSASRFFVRANAYRTRIDGTISNVTLTVVPGLITRQRQNAGETTAAGVEVEGEFRYRQIGLSAGYLFVHSRVTAFPSNQDLVGRLIPQVARHQVTAQFRYVAERWAVSVQARASGEQFDDDLNTLRLEPYFQADAFVSRKLSRRLSLYAGVENIFNSRYSIARTPVRSVNSPANVRVGIRWN